MKPRRLMQQLTKIRWVFLGRSLQKFALLVSTIALFFVSNSFFTKPNTILTFSR
jgi:hypothetical protein